MLFGHLASRFSAHPENLATEAVAFIANRSDATRDALRRLVARTGIELPRPVKPGETIYAESTIGPVRGSHSRPTQGIAKVETRAFVESGELVCRYQRALLVYRRGMGPYAAAGY